MPSARQFCRSKSVLDVLSSYSNKAHTLRIGHDGLEELGELAHRAVILTPPELADKVARMLARLDVAKAPEQMDLPGLKRHPLKGELKGFWSVWVSGNWRIIFRFDGTDVTQVDLVDYH